MMTGAILGGSSVQQAAKLQMIILFMITASTTLASVFITFAIFVLVDRAHRVRLDRIEMNGEQWFHIRQWDLKKFVRWFNDFRWRPNKRDKSDSERELMIA
jgi:hypothetical protein